MDAQTLKALIKESLREVLREEFPELIHGAIPEVSDEEQEEIEREFGGRENYKLDEFVDMTEEVENAGQV